MIEDSKSDYVGRITFVLCLLAAIILLININAVGSAVRAALALCASSIVPSLFPFMILSDIMINRSDMVYMARKLGIPFSAVFGISPMGVCAFVLGLICGFPVGGKICASLYESGALTKEECERLLPYVNNTSPAFVIGSVGATMLGRVKIGVILFLIQTLSAVLIGFFERGTNHGIIYIKETDKDSKSCKSSFVDSVKRGAENTVYLCAFIIIFSLICRICNLFIKNTVIISLIASFLEIGTASQIITQNTILPLSIKLPLLSFALSFSGMSVFFQTCVFTAPLKIRMRRYLVCKLVSGIISAFIVFLCAKTMF
ncbi:MAG: hypothetical protein SOZ62_04320 [Eubacteriales bacterium]|nr:hypothetical protein [Eubacteriales bacterium]